MSRILEHTEVLRAYRYFEISSIVNEHLNLNKIVTALISEIYRYEGSDKNYVMVEAQYDTVSLDENGESCLIHGAIYSDSYEMDGNYREVLIKALLDVEAKFIKEINEGKTIWINLINDEINHINYVTKMLKDMDDDSEEEEDTLKSLVESVGGTIKEVEINTIEELESFIEDVMEEAEVAQC